MLREVRPRQLNTEAFFILMMKSTKLIFAALLGSGILVKVSFGYMPPPDFQSTWQTLVAQSRLDAMLIVDHSLGEVPLLVDVQAKVIEGPNSGYIFPAIGACPRDDDGSESYGVVCFIYNENHVRIWTPSKANDNGKGFAVYTGDGIHYTGPNYQAVHTVQVRVRAWVATSFPEPDFSMTGIRVVARSKYVDKVFVERSHGLGEYPALVLVRTRLCSGYYSDSVGAAIYTPLRESSVIPYVVHGFNNVNVRVWVTSDDRGWLFSAQDGYYGQSYTTSDGSVEIYSWRAKTLLPLATTYGHVGVTFGTTEVAYEGFLLSEHTFLKVWAEAEDGINEGYRFPAGGALAFSSVTSDATCSYGGLVYSYSDTSVRFWWPTGVNNGGVICVADHMAYAVMSQKELDAGLIVSYWALLHAVEDIVRPTCNNPVHEREPRDKRIE